MLSAHLIKFLQSRFSADWHVPCPVHFAGIQGVDVTWAGENGEPDDWKRLGHAAEQSYKTQLAAGSCMTVSLAHQRHLNAIPKSLERTLTRCPI